MGKPATGARGGAFSKLAKAGASPAGAATSIGAVETGGASIVRAPTKSKSQAANRSEAMRTAKEQIEARFVGAWLAKNGTEYGAGEGFARFWEEVQEAGWDTCVARFPPPCYSYSW